MTYLYNFVPALGGGSDIHWGEDYHCKTYCMENTSKISSSTTGIVLKISILFKISSA